MVWVFELVEIQKLTLTLPSTEDATGRKILSDEIQSSPDTALEGPVTDIHGALARNLLYYFCRPARQSELLLLSFFFP